MFLNNVGYSKLREEVIEKLKEFCKNYEHQYNIDYVILFGSYAYNFIKPYSDIDIAIKLEKVGNDRIEIMYKFLKILSEILGTDNINIIILNDCLDDLLKFEIYTKGELICCKDYLKYLDDKVNAIL